MSSSYCYQPTKKEFEDILKLAKSWGIFPEGTLAWGPRFYPNRYLWYWPSDTYKKRMYYFSEGNLGDGKELSLKEFIQCLHSRGNPDRAIPHNKKLTLLFPGTFNEPIEGNHAYRRFMNRAQHATGSRKVKLMRKANRLARIAKQNNKIYV
jgi:hypothetical protein